MRLDHIAYRVADRWKAASFFSNALSYSVQQEFTINFDDGTSAQCIAMVPQNRYIGDLIWSELHQLLVPYHAPPEIFVSDGTPGSIVGRWVEERGGIGGIHHLAYEVDDVQRVMDEWKGLATFSSVKPIECEDLVQIFTNPHPITGVIYELIHRRGINGFCRDSVKQLMISSDGHFSK